jgi:hypothetical protein
MKGNAICRGSAIGFIVRVLVRTMLDALIHKAQQQRLVMSIGCLIVDPEVH